MKKYASLEKLKGFNSVCLIAHIEPDADALSSMIVLRDFLKNFFKIKTVNIYTETNSSLSENYLSILGNVKLNPKQQKYQAAIMMDSPNTERLGIYKNLFTEAKLKIVIDHHSTNLHNGDINFVEPVSSTCEIVYSILKAYKYNISTSNQGKLYAGIITDTNNFTVGNITKNTFKIASEFAPNIDCNEIYSAFLSNNSLKNMQMLAIAINNIVTFNHGNILITHISKEEANHYKANFQDFTGIINRIATINTAKLICFIEPKDDMYYVSMRCKKGYNISKIAVSQGGGGHTEAAAYLSDKTITEIEQFILKSFQDELANSRPVIAKLF